MTKNAKRALFLSIFVTMLLYVIPFGGIIGYPLVLLSTLTHEMGHGIAGWCVGLSWESFNIYANGSGVAYLSGDRGRIASGIVSAGGLVGPAIASAFLFGFARNATLSRVACISMGIALILFDLFLVRNLFGLTFVAVVAGALLIIGMRASKEFCQFSLVLVAIQLALSVFSRSDYLFTRMARTSAGTMPSDVSNMAEALFLPYWVWGIVCGGFSLLILALGVANFLRGSSTPEPQAE